jgi:hypothetical protein
VNDLSTWVRVLIYAAGAIATAIVLYVVVYLAARAALRASQAEQREAADRQEKLLHTIATSAEYVADVADAWAEGEAARRGLSGEAASPASEREDHAAARESGDRPSDR